VKKKDVDILAETDQVTCTRGLILLVVQGQRQHRRPSSQLTNITSTPQSVNFTAQNLAPDFNITLTDIISSSGCAYKSKYQKKFREALILGPPLKHNKSLSVPKRTPSKNTPTTN